MATAPLTILTRLVERRDEITEDIRQTVAVARERGATWQAIGDALGITRAAAWEQFHD